jgi:hypothetical protein
MDMANIYDSYIRCTTNPELTTIIDPEKIIEKTPSQFRFRRLDELVYETRWRTMHKDIIILSERFPNDVFMARYFFIDAFQNSPAECYQYRNGHAKFMGYEPLYKFSDHSHLMDYMGRDTMLKLWFRVKQYLFRLDQTKESLIHGELHYVDMLEDHYDYCIRSTVTVHAEVEKFKLTVDKIKNAELIFRGYTRANESEEWFEILPETIDQDLKE